MTDQFTSGGSRDATPTGAGLPSRPIVEPDGSVDLAALAERHRQGMFDPRFCACGSNFPCDATRLLGLVNEHLWSAGAYWRGTCGHTWPIRNGVPGPCPVCRVRKIAAEMAIAVLDLT